MKNNKLMKFLRLLLAFAIVLGFDVLGVLWNKKTNDEAKGIFGVVVIILLVIAALLILANVFFGIKYDEKLNISVKERREKYLQRRDEAINDLPKSVARITAWRRILVIYSCFVFLLGVALAFSIGVGDNSGLTAVPVYILYGLLSRIAPLTKRFKFEGYSDPKEYPYLHNMVNEICSMLGLKNKVRIIFLPDCNAGIAKIGSKYSLQLGVILLDLLSENELRQVLIHEFAHMAADGKTMEREHKLFRFISEKDEGHFSNTINSMYALLDKVYAYEYVMYRLSATIAVEKMADDAIKQYGDAQIAANALAKIAYYNDCFDRELEFHIEDHYFKPEECRDNVASVLRDAFRAAVVKRGDFWKELLNNEIQSQSASHPILRNRIEALGISDFTVEFSDDSHNAYGIEAAKAMEEANKARYESEREGYKEMRKEQYLKPLEAVEKWKAEGESLVAEEARPAMNALMALGECEELEALCNKIISLDVSRSEKAHAYMLKGLLRLRNYDKTGIELIYEAIDINTNYIDEGMNEIGEFCCKMGLADELEEYRRRVVELAQKQEDEYNHADSLTGEDNVCEETMPEEMKEELLCHILQLGEDKIQNVFLVRKIISESFFSSSFVIYFKLETEEEDINRIMGKIFVYLDTYPEEWQFSLFLYDSVTAAAVKKVPGCCLYDSTKK